MLHGRQWCEEEQNFSVSVGFSWEMFPAAAKHHNQLDITAGRAASSSP